jgi:hypothetical protein
MPKRPFDLTKQNFENTHSSSPKSVGIVPAIAASRYAEDRRVTGEILPPRHHRQSQRQPYQQKPQSPFKCSYCGNTRIEAFANVYSRGSSLSKYRKGLILKTHWAETRKQSVLAMRCAPPKKQNIWWGLLLSLVGLAGLRYLPTVIFGVAVPAAPASLILVTGVFTTAYMFIWNRVRYPKVMARWDHSFYCSRCAKVTIITPGA